VTIVLSGNTVPGKYIRSMPMSVKELGRILRGSSTPAAALVSYGGRAFDNAPAELCALLREAGFLPAAAGAFVCRHAFTDAVSAHRPDPDDLSQLRDFARRVAGQLSEPGAAGPLRVPGDPEAAYYVPLGSDGRAVNFLRAKPVTDPRLCTGCGRCAAVCPVGAVDPADTASVPGVCVKCCACVRACPAGAKSFADPGFLSHVDMLERTYGGARAENAVFYAETKGGR